MNENTIVEPPQSRVRRTSTAARSGLDVAEARDAVASITAQRRVHLAAACSRGMITAGLLGHLAAAGDLDKVASLTLMVCALDNATEGTVPALATRDLAAAAVAESARKGCLDGQAKAPGSYVLAS
jgi:polyhydroxyalkanoate synthase